MQFFKILATVFCGGTFWVDADYYVEFQSPPAVTNFRGQTTLTNFLYECRGDPAGRPAFRSVASFCTRVTTWTDKINIYHNCNFFSVHRPELQHHSMRLSDRPFFTRSHDWYLGVLNHAIDHPSFGQPPPDKITHFQQKIEELTNYADLPHPLVLNLAVYFATTNLITFSRNPDVANYFADFAEFLGRIVLQADAGEGQETNRDIARMLRDNSDRAVKLCLQKLIDPCAVLRGTLQTYASAHCETYCHFLSFASIYFNTCTSRCSTLSGGYCMGVVCTCDRELTNPLLGCRTDSLMSPMQLCHNSLRNELNL